MTAPLAPLPGHVEAAGGPSDPGSRIEEAKAVLFFFMRRAQDAGLKGTVEFLSRRISLLGSHKTADKISEVLRVGSRALRLEADSAKKIVASEIEGSARERIIAGARLLFLASEVLSDKAAVAMRKVEPPRGAVS